MNPNLIKNRFQKSLKTYDANAFVQQKMAKTLIDLLPKQVYQSVFEIGCGTGILTKACLESLGFDKYFANDIVEDCSEFIKFLNRDIVFLPGDVNTIDFNGRHDLIISNAVFQWFDDVEGLMSRLKDSLAPGGVIALSTFGEKNFYELKEVLNLGLDYPRFEGVKQEEVQELFFEDFSELLRHIKYTGVNALEPYRLTRGKIEAINKEFIARYGCVKLTYNPVYIINRG